MTIEEQLGHAKAIFTLMRDESHRTEWYMALAAKTLKDLSAVDDLTIQERLLGAIQALTQELTNVRR